MLSHRYLVAAVVVVTISLASRLNLESWVGGNLLP
jgi:hypothetical protein